MLAVKSLVFRFFLFLSEKRSRKIKLNFLGDDDSKSSINEPILRKKDSKWKRMSKYLRERVRKRTPTSIPEEDEKDEYYEDVDYPVKYGALDRCVRGECCGKGLRQIRVG